MRVIMTGIIAFGMMATSALAAPLEVTLEAWEIVSVTDQDGQVTEKRIQPNDIVPQDLVEIIASLENTTDLSMTSFSVELDIDPSMVINLDALNSSVDAEFTFSTHQNPDHFNEFNNLVVFDDDGLEQPAQAGDLGTIKVEFAEIGAAKNALVGYTAIVR